MSTDLHASKNHVRIALIKYISDKDMYKYVFTRAAKSSINDYPKSIKFSCFSSLQNQFCSFLASDIYNLDSPIIIDNQETSNALHTKTNSTQKNLRTKRGRLVFCSVTTTSTRPGNVNHKPNRQGLKRKKIPKIV